MAVLSQVKVRGHGLILRHIGCTPALSVTHTKITSASAVCGLWRYIKCYTYLPLPMPIDFCPLLGFYNLHLYHSLYLSPRCVMQID